MAKDCPDILYHYTSNEVFLSMLKNSEIWLSSMSSSNDAKEGMWFREQVAEKVSSLASSAFGLATARKVILGPQFIDALGFCMTQSGDQLSQWRGYGNEGKGVAIGFDARNLNELRELPHQEGQAGHILEKIGYGCTKEAEEFAEQLAELLEKGAFKVRGKRGLIDFRTDDEISNENEEIDRLGKLFSYGMVAMSATSYKFKNPSFVEEDEWRLMQIISSQAEQTEDVKELGKGIEFRVSADRISPYRRLYFEKGLPIRKLVVGPRNGTPLETFRSCLNANGYSKNVEVAQSVSTLR